MPKVQIKLNPFKDQIISQFNDNVSTKEIANCLTAKHSIACTDRTIQQRLKGQGIGKQARVIETLALCLKITTMYYMNFPNKIIVYALNQDSYLIGIT